MAELFLTMLARAGSLERLLAYALGPEPAEDFRSGDVRVRLPNRMAESQEIWGLRRPAPTASLHHGNRSGVLQRRRQAET